MTPFEQALIAELARIVQAQCESREQLERIAELLERAYKYGWHNPA